MNNNIVISGGTGVLGKFLLPSLLKTGAKIILLVRRSSYDKACELISENIQVVACDLGQNNLGLSKKEYEELSQNTTHIIHAAAATSFDLPIEIARENNVEPTRNMLLFAKNCQNLQQFGYVSTAYVAGKRTGMILEDEFEHTVGFLNTYQKSKYEAEEYVRAEKDHLPIIIFRPSIVVTPYKTTSDSPVNALTMALLFAQKGYLPILPGNDTYCIDIISGEFVASAIAQLLLAAKQSFSTYHITSSQKAPSVKDLIAFMEKKNNKRIATRFCGGIESFHVQLRHIVAFKPDLKIVYGKIDSFLPELSFPKKFENTHLLKDLHITAIPGNPMEEIKALLV